MMWFFFKVTATTEIYTYRHTLFLHDARPIYATYFHTEAEDFIEQVVAATTTTNRNIPKAEIKGAELGVQYDTPFLFAGVGRSEEHTSELQSLMRISYAVFCLQNKNYTTQLTIHTSPVNTTSITIINPH